MYLQNKYMYLQKFIFHIPNRYMILLNVLNYINLCDVNAIIY